MVSAILYVDDNLSSGPFPYGASKVYTAAVYAYVPSLGVTYKVLDDIDNGYTGYPSSTLFYSTTSGFLYEGSWTAGDQLISVSTDKIAVLDEDEAGTSIFPEEWHQKFLPVNGETVFLAFSEKVPDHNLSSTAQDDGGNALFITNGSDAPRTLFNASSVEDVYQLGDDRFVVRTLRYDWAQDPGKQQIHGTYVVDTTGNATLLTSSEWPDDNRDVREPFDVEGAFVFQGQDYIIGHFGGLGSDYSSEDIFRIDTSDGRLVKTGLINSSLIRTSSDADFVSLYVPENSSGYYYYLTHTSSAALLYRTDGTVEGTVSLWNSNDYGVGSGSGFRLAATAGDRVIFSDPLHTFVLSTDGTQAGTYDIAGEGTPVGWLRLGNENFVSIGNNAFFTTGREIYMTDGTVEGTRVVFEAKVESSDFGEIKSLHAVDGSLYFIADLENDDDYELWSLDGNGSNAGIVSVVDSGTGEYDRSPYVASVVDLQMEFLSDKEVVPVVASTFTGTDAAEALSGSAAADRIDALAGNDLLSGLGGNDFLKGGPGRDTIDGGAGSDTAIFSGQRSDYAIFTAASGETVVADGNGTRDGTDRLISVEVLNFGSGTMSLAEALVEPDDSDGSTYQVFRFYNPNTGAHFFTASVAERNYVIQNYADFLYEGNVFDSNATEASGGTEVYRFYNSERGTHFYTANAAEKDWVIATLTEFQYEGVAYYASADDSRGGTALYRFYNATSGAHFFTASEAEKDYVVSSLPSFQYEGIAYYVDIA